jgi:hypothetical protein
MNGTKTTIALSVLLGTILGGVALADLVDRPRPPHLILTCGQNSYIGSQSLEPVVRRFKKVMASLPSRGISESERIWLKISAPLVNSYEEWQLDCIMMQAGFIRKYESPHHITYKMYRDQFPFNPEEYIFSFSKNEGRPKLETVSIDSGMS